VAILGESHPASRLIRKQFRLANSDDMPLVADRRRARMVRPIQGKLLIRQSVRHLRLSELPTTKRLRSVLRAMRVRTLGDLNGRDLGELLKQRHCGVQTISALQGLIQRAIAGEFSHSRVQESTPVAELLRLIEIAIDNLPLADKDLLLRRVGVQGRRPMTLEQLGQQRGITRERVRVIVKKLIDVVRKTFGSRIPRLLELVRKRCLSDVCPLTPELLKQWAPQFRSDLQLSAKAHVRILGALDEGIPAWPGGHVLLGYGDRDLRKLGVHLATVARQAGGAVSIAEAYRRLKTRRGYGRLTVDEFLRLLRKSRRIRIQFDEPQRPVVRAFRRRILRRRSAGT
jgi:hypothetical protein